MKDKKCVNIAVVGATGYVGYEIVRLLCRHPFVKLTALASQSFVGKRYSEVYPSLAGMVEMECCGIDSPDITEGADIIITCLPHGVSKDIIPKVVRNGKRVIDHSADFRYKSAAVYEKWYGVRHEMTDLIGLSVYGLPEIHRRQIRKAAIVANPGCYPTCSILGLKPLLSSGLIDEKSIIIDAVSGVSGAGRATELQFQFCECNENYKAYKVACHRHTSEIEQELGLIAGNDITVTFTPHLAPMKRGMLCTAYASLKKKINTAGLREVFINHYKDEYFVRIMSEGVSPETKHVAGSNFIDISPVADERTGRVIILSAIDNLGKGSAGQAVQDLNIMCGFPESTGLEAAGTYI